MGAQNAPSEAVKALVARMGASMWTDVTDYAAGGTAVARAEVENYSVPDKARMLLGWRPVEYGADLAAAESLLSVFDISGSNYNYQPQEVICGTLAPSYLLTGGLVQAPSEYYDVFAPVAGGENISIGIEPCDAIAGNRRAAAEFTWCDKKLPLPVIRSKCSREVVVDGAGVSAGTTLNITSAGELIEVDGALAQAGLTVEEEMMVTLIIKCTALPVNEISMLLEAMGCGGDEAVDEACPMHYLARRQQRLKFSQKTATITADFDLDVDVTNAAAGVHCIRWI